MTIKTINKDYYSVHTNHDTHYTKYCFERKGAVNAEENGLRDFSEAIEKR